MNKMNSLEEIKNLWQKEKLEYEKSEIGCGVQTFVYSVFSVRFIWLK